MEQETIKITRDFKEKFYLFVEEKIGIDDCVTRCAIDNFSVVHYFICAYSKTWDIREIKEINPDLIIFLACHIIKVGRDECYRIGFWKKHKGLGISQMYCTTPEPETDCSAFFGEIKELESADKQMFSIIIQWLCERPVKVDQRETIFIIEE